MTPTAQVSAQPIDNVSPSPNPMTAARYPNSVRPASTVKRVLPSERGGIVS